MAKKIRLIDKALTEATAIVADAADAADAPQDDNTGTAFTKSDVATLMKLADAIDWKLWELLKFTRKLEAAQDPDQDQD